MRKQRLIIIMSYTIRFVVVVGGGSGSGGGGSKGGGVLFSYLEHFISQHTSCTPFRFCGGMHVVYANLNIQ